MGINRFVSKVLMIAAGLGYALLSAAVAPVAASPEILVLSNRADLISGGDALVEIKWPVGANIALAKIALNGVNVKPAFAVRANGRYMGLVTGLKNGNNLLTARYPAAGAQITITNHPIGGPVLLGSQTTPWICATKVPTSESGNTPATNASGLLGIASNDGQCNIATEARLWYRTKTATTGPGACSFVLPDPSPTIANPNPTTPANSCLQPYFHGTTPLSSVADSLVTINGAPVPYIVRVERGTLNRGIYDIAVLFDPTKPWSAVAPQAQWNGKVVYSFGASTGQPRLQFRTEQNWADDAALSRGFMVVDNSLTDSLYDSNRTLETETLLMMKEHIVDTYGEIKYTLGNGCSGGSIGQNTAASIYPGLLDAIQPSCDYPDSITTGLEVGDCVLLVNFYAGTEWTTLMSGLTQAQINAKKKAINGHLDHTGCHGWNNSFGFNNKPGNYYRTLVANSAGALFTESPPTAQRNNCLLPASRVYDPVSNPDGTRCGDPDLATAVWGTTNNANAPGHLRALQTGDNVGIQYGLNALFAGAITPEEFVTLNERIGGSDADSNRTAAAVTSGPAPRSMADLDALAIAYKSGIVGSGANLGKLPIIDSRGFDEAPPPIGAVGIHYIWRSFSERARIDADNGGNHGNQVMWRYGTGLLPGTAAQVAAVTVQSLLTMDAWLNKLNIDAPKATLNSVRTQAQVIAAKPTAVALGAFDFCFLSTDPLFATRVTDSRCETDFPQSDGLGRMAKRSSPRQVAGGPLVENILKCQLKALNSADYAPIIFSDAQWAGLQAAFPDGVCDWSLPGVGQQPPVSPLTFVNGPGGVPLPPAPLSSQIP